MVKLPTVSAEGASLLLPPPSLLERNSEISMNTRPLSELQGQVDGICAGFAERLGDWKSLAALTAGGLAHRLGRMGLAFASAESALPKALSVAAGLVSEVSVFEGVSRALHSQNPNRWRWSGGSGVSQGLEASLITFGALRGLGTLARGENFILQQGAQASGMVFGHQLAYRAGAAPKPEGSLAEQFLHAEAFNLQWAAGMSLAYGLAPRLRAFEKGLDLLHSFPTSFPKIFAEGTRAFASATAGASVRLFSKSSEPSQDGNLVQMSILETGEGSFGREEAFRALIELRRRIAAPERLEAGEGEWILNGFRKLPAGFHLFGICEALVALGHRRDFFDQMALMATLRQVTDEAKEVLVDLDGDEARAYFGEFSPEADPKKGLPELGIPSPFIESIFAQSMDFLMIAKVENPMHYETEQVHDALFLTSLIALSSAVNFKGGENIQGLINLIEHATRNNLIIDFTLTQALSQVPLESDQHRLLFMQAVEGLPDPRSRVLALVDRARHLSVDEEELSGLLKLIEWQNAGASWEAQAYTALLKNRSIYEPEILENMGRRLIHLLAMSSGDSEEILEPLTRIAANPIFSGDALERLADFMEEAGLPTLQGARVYRRMRWVREQRPHVQN